MSGMAPEKASWEDTLEASAMAPKVMALGALVTERGRWIGIPWECGGVGCGVVGDGAGEGVVEGHVGGVALKG